MPRGQVGGWAWRGLAATSPAMSLLSTDVPAALAGLRLAWSWKHVNTSVPNPSQGTFTVNGRLGSNAEGPVAIDVLNALGQVVCRTATRSEIGAFSKFIQLSVPAGIYMVRVCAGDEYGVMRLHIGL